MNDTEGTIKIVFAILLFMVALGGLYAGCRADEEAREDCVRSGGRVVEVHNARSANGLVPWTCER